MRRSTLTRAAIALVACAALYVGSFLAMGALTDDPVRKGGGRPAIYFARATFINSTNLNESLNPPAQAYLLHELRIHHTVPTATGTLTVQISSQAETTSGGLHNVIVHTKDMASVVDHVWQPTRPMPIDRDDVTSITWNNTTATTGGLEVLWEPL